MMKTVEGNLNDFFEPADQSSNLQRTELDGFHINRHAKNLSEIRKMEPAYHKQPGSFIVENNLATEASQIYLDEAQNV